MGRTRANDAGKGGKLRKWVQCGVAVSIRPDAAHATPVAVIDKTRRLPDSRTATANESRSYIYNWVGARRVSDLQNRSGKGGNYKYSWDGR